MTCIEIKKLFPVYLDKKADEGQKEMVEKHLAECERCSLEYSLLISIEKTFLTAEKAEAPDFLRGRILAEIAAEREARKEKRSLYIVSAAFAFTFIIALLFVIPFGWVHPLLTYLTENFEFYGELTFSLAGIKIKELLSTLFLSEMSYKYGLAAVIGIGSLIYFAVDRLIYRRI